MNSKKYTGEIGPYESTLILYGVEYDTEEECQKWNGKLIVNDIEYVGYILFKDDDYLRSIFDSEESDVFTDLEGLEYEIDNFLEDIFYETLNESLLLEGRIDDIQERFDKKINPDIVDYFRKNDPTENKAYFEWLCSRYSKLDKTDKGIEKTMIKMIIKYQNIKSNINDNRIEQIKSVKDLGNIIDKNRSWEVLRGLQKETAEIHHDSFEWIIFTPYEESISEVYGDKAWCTVYSVSQHFESHFGHKGALTYCMNKLNDSSNFAIEQTILENGERKCTVWDHNDHNILKDEYLSDVVSDLSLMSYLDKDSMLKKEWNKIVEDMPYPEMTEAVLKPLFTKIIKEKGIVWCAKQFGAYVIFDTIDESDGYHKLNDLVDEKLKNLIIKNPKKYLDDNVFYWTIIDNFFKESNDIIEDSGDLPVDVIMDNLGIDKVIELFPKDKLSELIDLYIKRLYGIRNIEEKIEVMFNLDGSHPKLDVDIIKLMEDVMPWESLAVSLIRIHQFYEYNIEDLREIIETNE